MKLIIMWLSVALCCLSACGQPAAQGERHAPKDSEHHGLSEMERENQNSYEAGYEAGFEAGAQEGAHNPGDYLSKEEVEDAEGSVEDILDEYAEEYGYYKVN